ncbi:alpha/beta fold hydrolase [Candidatus Wolfebacteria bacterium]|nr:alpha/beta fold hydrolase [Candidatus Wolfebacteria bacterium]
MKKTVSFQTKDDVKIVGDFYPVRSDASNGVYDAKSLKSVILLHILPGNRRDFNSFAEILFANGYNVLNIDERGHGESEAWPGETGSWQEFTQADYDKMIYDVDAAADWLKNKIPDTELAVIGGSIGANLALLYGAKVQSKIVVALSPGIDYHGVKTEIASRNYRQNLLIAASRDDDYAFKSSEKLFDISKASRKDFVKYESAGHGTRMFDAEPELQKRILDFLAKHF